MPEGDCLLRSHQSDDRCALADQVCPRGNNAGMSLEHFLIRTALLGMHCMLSSSMSTCVEVTNGTYWLPTVCGQGCRADGSCKPSSPTGTERDLGEDDCNNDMAGTEWLTLLYPSQDRDELDLSCFMARLLGVFQAVKTPRVRRSVLTPWA